MKKIGKFTIVVEWTTNRVTVGADVGYLSHSVRKAAEAELRRFGYPFWIEGRDLIVDVSDSHESDKSTMVTVVAMVDQVKIVASQVAAKRRERELRDALLSVLNPSPLPTTTRGI